MTDVTVKLINGKPKKCGAYFVRTVKGGQVSYSVLALPSPDHLKDNSWTDYKYVTHYAQLEDIEESFTGKGK